MLQKLIETTEYLKQKLEFTPKIAIILGTGLGELVKEITITQEIHYSDIPNFPVSTVEGHAGKFILGHLGGKEVVAMQGRFHFYEGYSMDQVTFPIRVMKLLGISHLFVSNASGSLNPDYKVGDLVIIEDHINMFGTNPLIGPNIKEFGPRFPDMSAAYNKQLIKQAQNIAANNSINIQQGVYVGTTGPTFETVAEYKHFRIIGGDLVGMSTVPEVIVAHHAGITCFGISIVTDSGVPGHIKEISHEEVQQVANLAQPKMTFIFKEMIKTL